MQRSDHEALRRLIEYAKLEAEEQKQAFTAYLLDLAYASVEHSGIGIREFLAFNGVREGPDGGLQ